jgi:predicted AAA+ superfamily ATPase
MQRALDKVPVVALIGPRQVGKTTLALSFAEKASKPCTYLDLELDSDFNKLTDAEAYLRRFQNELLIIDEVQRKPDLFPLLRGLVDKRKRKGEKAGHFLLLGSASRDVLQHASETLAGRIRYLELPPFTVRELAKEAPAHFDLDTLWFRGGFPDSYLAEDDAASWDWRSDFITTYLERDIPQMGVNIPAARFRRFWTMLAHYHGQQVVLSTLARSMELSHTTIRHYLDLLTDFFMIRQLPPWSGNIKKRLVKTPKIYLRDTGVLHRLLQISSFEGLMGNPIVGASWEGFAIEQILNQLDDRWSYSYYRTHTQVEIDLVLETPRREIWAVEVKRASAPRLSRGFHQACEDVKAHKKWVIHAGTDRYPLPREVEVIGLTEFLAFLAKFPLQT